MKKVSAKEAYKILKRAGSDASGDGITFFAYDEKADEIYGFDTKRERDEFIERANNKIERESKMYKVSFQYSESTYCSNIVIASNEDDVREHYNSYSWFDIQPASEYDLECANRKGMPIINLVR